MIFNKSLKNELVNIWTLVNSQHNKSLMALLQQDNDLTREIIVIDERVNSYELSIDKICETYLSRRNTHAVNVPFIMLAMRINRQVGRLGDLATHIAKEILSMKTMPNEQMLHESRVVELYTIVIQLLKLATNWFENGMKNEPSLDNTITDFIDTYAGSREQLVAHINKYPEESDIAIHIFSITKFLDNCVSNVRTLVEEIIIKSSRPNWMNTEFQSVMLGY